MRTSKLLEKLIVVKDKINAKIPLASNRYEEFETCPADADLAYTDELDKRYFEHEAKLQVARVAYYVNQGLQAAFKQYCIDHHWTAPYHISAEQRRVLRAHLLSQCKGISDTYERNYRLLGTSMDVRAIYLFVTEHVDEILNRLIANQALTIVYEEYLQRIILDERLSELRGISMNQMLSNSQFSTPLGMDEPNRELVLKASRIQSGIFFDETNADVGYCDEHACLGLYYIFRDIYLNEFNIKTIEKVSIDYEEGDGHTFLVLDRDPESKLSDMSSWGNDAIIFDAWNKIVCYASDFPKLPLQYLSYPSDAKWESLTFKPKDKSLKDSLNKLNVILSITGNDIPEKRYPSLMEEFQLTALDTLPKTHVLINGIIKKCKPDNFNIELKLFVACSGNKFVTVIPGFELPAIAIHVNFLKNNSIEELYFAIAITLLEIKYCGAGIMYSLGALQQQSIDKEVIARFCNAEAAKTYLRNLMLLPKNDIKDVKMVTLDDGFDSIIGPKERIKNILTLLAQHPEWQGSETRTVPPAEVLAEVDSIQPRYRYRDAVAGLPDNVSKLQYLTQQLESLKDELFPYEYCEKPCVRSREFGDLLHEMEVDLKNPEQFAAAGELINRAHHLRIPSFYYLYSRLDKHTLNPIGIFHDLQLKITAFVNANTADEAEMLATDLLQALEEIKMHRYSGATEQHYVEKGIAEYKKQHGTIPKGNDRIFLTALVWFIRWQSFSKTEPPAAINQWDKHIEWCLATNSKNIAQALWVTGIREDQRYWPVLSNEELLALRHTNALAPHPGKDHNNIACTYKSDLAKLISNRHILDASMFDGVKSFEASFIEFYDANAPALQSCDDMFNFNLNTSAVHYLLQQFLSIIKSGSAEQQQVVKSFFLGRDDKRDFENMRYHGMFGKIIGGLEYKDPYSLFVLKQHYKKERFSFFTLDERKQFMDLVPISPNRMKWTTLVKIFDIEPQGHTFETLEKILSYLDKFKGYEALINIIRTFIEHNPKLKILSVEGIKLIRLTRQTAPYYLREVIGKLSWDMTDIEEIERVPVSDMTYIYRTVDVTLCIPNNDIRLALSDIVLGKILAVKEPTDMVLSIEDLLLLSNGKIDVAISDIILRNKLIALWVENIFKIYGSDNKTDDYFNRLKPIIERIEKSAAASDKIRMLSQLANAITAQWKISEYMGVLLEPDKFLVNDKPKKDLLAISTLAVISRTLSKDAAHQAAFLKFLSEPFDETSLKEFTQHLMNYDAGHQIISAICKDNKNGPHSHEAQKAALELIVYSLYLNFWDRPLEERAVMIEYLLIPVECVGNDADIEKAYIKSLNYICKKVFPDMDDEKSDDHFAASFLNSYLEATDKYIRSFLLAGLLVACRNSQAEGEKPGVGKKLVMVAEHMGPAYIKIIQAINSHPDTPNHIRADTQHAKSRANPPHRWTIWRMIMTVLPEVDRLKIRHVGGLLGCASYNMGVRVQLNNGKNVVLSLLREHAERDAVSGFDHLARTVEANEHPRLADIKQTGIAMIQEAKAMSALEMNDISSEQQYHLANRFYHCKMMVNGFEVSVKPVCLLKGGIGYRFIDLVRGVEFNDLPCVTANEKNRVVAVAKTLMTIELINIFRCQQFDSDRHGNQCKALIAADNKISVGMYDFGEMSLIPPSREQISQFVAVLKAIFKTIAKTRSFDGVFDSVMTAHIDLAIQRGDDISYLMRIRKGLLALQDFQRHLSHLDMLDVIFAVAKSKEIHPAIRRLLVLNTIPVKLGFFGKTDRNTTPLPPPPKPK